MFTEIDNKTFDLSKVLAFAVVVAGLCFSGWGVIVNGQPFNMQDFGIGMGALFTGLGITFFAKKETDA